MMFDGNALIARRTAIKRWLGLILERRALIGSVYNSPRKEETSHAIRFRIPRADARVDTHWKVRAFGKRMPYVELARRIRRQRRGQKPGRACIRVEKVSRQTF